MATPVGRLRIAFDLWRQYGTRNFGYRLYHAAWRRAGLLKRRFAANAWDDRPLAQWLNGQAFGPLPASVEHYKQFREATEARFFFDPRKLPQVPAPWAEDAVNKAEAILAGRLSYFSGPCAPLGFPFDWFLNPFTGSRVDAARHWCDRDDFEPQQGDIKFYWEPSRFSWVFPLVRAYAATGDERYADAFWRLVESWRAANPPNMGPNWQCGQECALRALALCFGLYGFAAAAVSTSARTAMLAAMLAVHAERIERNIRFAETQMSNHALSEAVGLYTIGTLFPEFERAGHWRKRGKHIIEKEARLHSYADGSYIQHSMNYHRLMMHDYLWALRLAELHGDAFSNFLTDVVGRHAEFVYMLQEESNGMVPNYGQNDGALLLPLSGCAYRDYRPVVQATYYQLHRRRVYAAGPWDEDLFWLFGPQAASAPQAEIQRQSRRYDVGGYYVLRGATTWGFMRCHSFRHHPHQADMLHLDVWWRGLNVLRDSGSYSYNAPEPWKHYFVSTRAHNSIELGGQSQMIKARRFTWVYPTRSRLHHFRRLPRGIDFVQGEHYGYRRLPSRATHRRAVLRLGESYWIVVDDILGQGAEEIGLYWHLLDAPFERRPQGLNLTSEAGPISLDVWADGVPSETGIARGQESPRVLGWNSDHYGEKLPAPTLWLEAHAELPVRLISILGFASGTHWHFEPGDNRLHGATGEEGGPLQVGLRPLAPGTAPVVEWVSWNEGSRVSVDAEGG
jgi:asparagine synthase (glutamine-hydrolysing)